MVLKISQSVGIGGVNLAADVIAVRSQLVDLGFCWAAGSSWADVGLSNTIKLFQSIVGGFNTIQGDGRIDVGGRTHRWLQAINAPRWVLMPTDGAGFRNDEAADKTDQHDWGTDWLAQTLIGAGAAYWRSWQATHPSASPLTLNDASLPTGGDTPKHAGHETGMGIDLRLPRTDGKVGGILTTDKLFDRSAMRQQLIALRAQPLFKRVYLNDLELNGEGLCLRLDGHTDHAHGEIKTPVL